MLRTVLLTPLLSLHLYLGAESLRLAQTGIWKDKDPEGLVYLGPGMKYLDTFPCFPRLLSWWWPVCHGSCDAFQFQGLTCVWKSAWNLVPTSLFLCPFWLATGFYPNQPGIAPIGMQGLEQVALPRQKLLLSDIHAQPT